MDVAHRTHAEFNWNSRFVARLTRILSPRSKFIDYFCFAPDWYPKHVHQQLIYTYDYNALFYI